MTVHGNFFAALVSFAAVLSACGVQKTVGQNEDKNFSIISVMSFNVRVDMPSDTPNTWTNRKFWVENIMSKERFILYYYPKLPEDDYGEITNEADFNFAAEAYENVDR